MNLIKLCTMVATLGPVGYFGASGTVATILTIPLVYYLHAFFLNQWFYFGIAICCYMVSIMIVNRALLYIKRHDDPSEIVLDEVVGCIFVFGGIVLSAKSIVVGFILFRALDIIKFGLVKKAESWANAWGVMGDDLIAALITNIILRVLL